MLHQGPTFLMILGHPTYFFIFPPTLSERGDFSIRRRGCWISESEIDHINMYEALRPFFEVWFFCLMDAFVLTFFPSPSSPVNPYSDQLALWMDLKTLWLSAISISISFCIVIILSKSFILYLSKSAFTPSIFLFPQKCYENVGTLSSLLLGGGWDTAL